ncbi:helix-turn-helix domain-containing protein [Streptomyces iconiensis]|uniref:Helix-turn-helix transcriptional regulator n=1 Tax=Streptomyces iconiensis TaxID=1384038 RepID=A0ABT6ZQW0_9ACTN|nr:helix-turn-helix transcriptional regulator [Streptomyces iconiensis]MDJ1131438.1 helix-turn-helix transcriptional regulator [Streptomyces iconiensis]
MSAADEGSARASERGSVVLDLQGRTENPVAAQRVLGSYLRDLRQRHGLTIREVKERGALAASVSKISRLECGIVPASERDVYDLLHFYGVRDQETLAGIHDLLRQARGSAWWQPYKDVMPDWLVRLISMEAQAQVIRTYETHAVPGLLQTPGYAAALVRAGLPEANEDELRQRVELRMRRQELLCAADAPRVLAVLDQSVLMRRFGSPDVMREQMRHLRDLADRDGVNIRVVRLDSGVVAPPSAFTYMTFSARGVSEEMVYLETVGGAEYRTKSGEVRHFRRSMEHLQGYAEPRRASLDLLATAEKRFSVS